MKRVWTADSPDPALWVCRHAAIASVCEVAIDEVPSHGIDDDWLDYFDLQAVGHDHDRPPPGTWAYMSAPVAIWGHNGRPIARHAVVTYDGVVVHDPSVDVPLCWPDNWVSFHAKGFEDSNHWLLQPPEVYEDQEAQEARESPRVREAREATAAREARETRAAFAFEKARTTLTPDPTTTVRGRCALRDTSWGREPGTLGHVTTPGVT